MKAKLHFFNKKTLNPNLVITQVTQYAKMYFNEVPELYKAICLCPELYDILMKQKNVDTDKSGNLYVVFKATGTSRCHKGDLFDAEYGYQLADTRSQKKIYGQAEKFLELVLYFFEKNITDMLSDRLSKITDLKYGCIDHELELLNKNEEI